MTYLHCKSISGSIAFFFLVGCLTISNVFGETSDSNMQLREDAKRLILGAEKMKKRKKIQSEKKSVTENKREKSGQQKKANREVD